MLRGFTVLYVLQYFQNHLSCFYNKKNKNKTKTYTEKMKIFENAFNIFKKSTEKNTTSNGMRYCLVYSFRSRKFNRSLGTAN